MEDELFAKLNKDLREAARTMTGREARFLCDFYLRAQDERKRADQRLDKSNGETNAVLLWTSKNFSALENQIKSALKFYAESQPMGQYAMKVRGIAAVIASGLLAHIDITKAPTCGHIYSFGGWNPEMEWKKGQKRPFNAALKQLFYFLGECFVKQSNHPDSLYGRLYRERKAYESAKNEAGDYKEQAEKGAARVAKSTVAYKSYAQGKLPLGHLHRRAARWAVKIFLSHWHEQAYWYHFGEAPPACFAISQLHHVHYIHPEVPIEKRRSIGDERTIVEEKANPEDRNTADERASCSEGTNDGERVIILERTTAQERASSSDRNKGLERASLAD